MNEKLYDIKEVSKVCNLSEVYVRRMILQGKLQTTKVQVSENVWKHCLTQSQVDELKLRKSTKTKRSDGRNKFTTYLNEQEKIEVQKFLEERKIELLRSSEMYKK